MKNLTLADTIAKVDNQCLLLIEEAKQMYKELGITEEYPEEPWNPLVRTLRLIDKYHYEEVKRLML